MTFVIRAVEWLVVIEQALGYIRRSIERQEQLLHQLRK